MDFRPDFSWEFLSSDEIEAKTVRALRNHVKHLKESSHYYREILQNILSDDIQSIHDFQQLPFTDKTVLTEHTTKFVNVHPDQIVETVLSSDSTGKPLIFPLTGNDLERLAFNEALSFHSIGITPSDRVQLFVNFDKVSLAGMAYYRGLVQLGANTMRVGVLPVEFHRYYLDVLKPSVIIAAPNYLKKLGLELKKQNFDTTNSTVNKIICIGESLNDQDMQLSATGKVLEELWGAKVFSTYASTELSVSYCECEARQGGHAHPELVFTEIVDEKGNPVPDGTPGELVATPFGVEAMPLLRYRTGEITFKINSQCSCGRNSMRIGPVLGHKSQIIKTKGTTIYPLTLTNALDSLDEIQDYLIILENDDTQSDRVSIHAVTHPSNIEKIANHLRNVAHVNYPILVSNLATIQSLRGASRKKVKIVDWRNQLVKK